MTEKVDEQIDVFDEQGHPLGVRVRSEVHTKPLQYWHRVVNIWLVDREGRILCTKRSEKVGGNPGKWQTYVGGHVQAGRDPEQTAFIEVEEETGIRMDQGRLHHVESGRWEPSKHLTESYAYLCDGTEHIRFQDAEIGK